MKGESAKINGVNALSLNATNGLSLSQSGSTATISGKTLSDGIADINSLIPNQATTTNQLADKDFVNSSINNMAAFYITSDVDGDPFATRADLLAGPWYNQGVQKAPTRNDYALVSEDEAHDDMTSRYMYDGTQWVWQYTLNNTKFTQEQIDALNSGITEELVAQIGTNASNITSLQTGKQDVLTQGVGISIDNNTISNSGVRSVSTGGTNGTISVNTNGTSAEVAVAGLGTAAYTASTDYATSAQGGKADTAIQGVQINSTDLTPDANNKVNIPVAGQNSLGVVATASNFGTAYSTALYLVKATDAEILAKTHNYKPIVPANLDKAVMEGLGNNSLTWTDAYKSSACNTIGASQQTIFRDWIG